MPRFSLTSSVYYIYIHVQMFSIHLEIRKLQLSVLFDALIKHEKFIKKPNDSRYNVNIAESRRTNIRNLETFIPASLYTSPSASSKVAAVFLFKLFTHFTNLLMSAHHVIAHFFQCMLVFKPFPERSISAS